MKSPYSTAELLPVDHDSTPEECTENVLPPGLEPNHSFALSDVVNEDDARFEPWPAEFADVDISIARKDTAIFPSVRYLYLS